MATLKKNYLVKKRNVLNEMRANNFTWQELRLFSIYLSRINPKDLSTRAVRFRFADFQAIMELTSRVKLDHMNQVTDSLLSKIIRVPTERGGYNAFQLFKRCRVDADDSGEWFIEIDAHDDALPLMFEFKEKYFTYQLWNALRLKSSNQLRMYEILKQYEKIGSRILSVADLKNLLGIAETEYSLYADFRRDVLDACQKALAEHTDIKFTYEPYGRRGKGGKILQIKFTIQKNEGYKDQLSLHEFIQEQNDNVEDDSEMSDYEKKILFLADACENEFSALEIIVLHDKMVELLPSEVIRDSLKCYDYLTRKYRYMNMQNEKYKIRNRFKYMGSIIGKD